MNPHRVPKLAGALILGALIVVPILLDMGSAPLGDPNTVIYKARVVKLSQVSATAWQAQWVGAGGQSFQCVGVDRATALSAAESSIDQGM